MRVIPYTPKYKKDFVEMNQAWISTMFTMEAEDIRELENVETIIEKGGNIFFTLDDKEEVMPAA